MIVDANTLGRDITLAVVALKLIVGGVVFVVLGRRRLRTARARDRGAYSRSMIVTFAWPPPSHMVCSP